MRYKHIRKMEHQKLEAERKARAEAELMGRALGAIKAMREPITPQGEIYALEMYIEGLYAILEETQAKHGADPNWSAAIYGIDREIQFAASKVIAKKIGLLNNQRVGV